MKMSEDVRWMAKALADRRTELGVTLAEVSRDSGVGASTLWYAEQGRAGFTVSTLFAAVRALGGTITVEWESQ